MAQDIYTQADDETVACVYPKRGSVGLRVLCGCVNEKTATSEMGVAARRSVFPRYRSWRLSFSASDQTPSHISRIARPGPSWQTISRCFIPASSCAASPRETKQR